MHHAPPVSEKSAGMVNLFSSNVDTTQELEGHFYENIFSHVVYSTYKVNYNFNNVSTPARVKGF
jgi:hypothetical protein